MNICNCPFSSVSRAIYCWLLTTVFLIACSTANSAKSQEPTTLVASQVSSTPLHSNTPTPKVFATPLPSSPTRTATVSQTPNPLRTTSQPSPVLIATLSYFKEHINRLVFSLDGQTLAVNGTWEEDEIAIWDIPTRTLRATIQSSEYLGWPCYLALSPDGLLLATANPFSGKVVLWNAETGQLLNKLQSDSARGLAFSPDGKILAIGGQWAIWLWNIQESTVIQVLGPKSREINYLAFSVDGKTLASVGSNDPVVQMWDVTTGKILSTFEPPDYRNRSMMSFSMEGQVLIIPKNANPPVSLEVWDTASGDALKLIPGFGDFYFEIALNVDGRLLATSEFNNTQIWDTSTGQPLHKFGVGENVTLSFSPDNRVLAFGDNNGVVELWDISSLSQPLSPE